MDATALPTALRYGDAQLACASFLRATMKEEHYAMQNPFQLMGVYACANLSDLYTKDGQRLFIHGVLRDWSGSVPVCFLDSCALMLLQCSSKEEVVEKTADHTLSVISEQLNVRGVKIGGGYHIVQISVCESFMEPSKTALRLADLASLCGPSMPRLHSQHAQTCGWNAILGRPSHTALLQH